MPDIGAIIEELLVATIINDKILFPVQNRTNWFWTAFSVFLGCIGIVLLIVGFDWFLEERYPPHVAALASAGLAFVIALIAAAVAYYYRHKKISMQKTIRQELGKNIQSLMGDICGEIDEPVRENPKTAVALAALAGFFIAHSRLKSN